jgi:ribose/xylose/arabinose/galactoside ABC-type transport system permease subunit
VRRSAGLYAPPVASGLAGVAAAVVVVVHMAFLAYIVFGGFLGLLRPVLLWPSIVATLYSAYVTLASYTCPLTRLEKWLLEAGGRVPYEESFIAHYLHGVLFPAQYERAVWMTAMAIALVSYVLVLTRPRRRVTVS